MKYIQKLLTSVITISLVTSITHLPTVQAVDTDGSANTWTYEKARHLASKTLFGPNKEIVDQLYNAGSASAAIDIIFPSPDGPDRTEFEQILTESELYDPTSFENDRTKMEKYYVAKRYLDPYQAKAKLFAIFEDIYAVDQIRDRIDYSDIERTHNMLYSNALGSYKQMVKDNLFGTDGSYALGEYLDFFDLNKNNPNENYARELIQLFMMDIFKPYNNHNTPDLVRNYSEEDVAALAKILTGFTFNTGSHIVSLDLEEHNTSTGVIFLDGDLQE
ncbi:MAG: DUF1800 family protein [Patescibacteria group bacterium]|nr:DUF1800 family protein [Patescibacteria group bacterium]